jgi:hypothetical protein
MWASIPTRGNWIIVGGDAHIAPFGAFIDRGEWIDVGIDPYKVVIGAEDNFQLSIFNF